WLTNSRPGLGLATDASEQATTCHYDVLVLDGACAGKDLVEIRDENLPLPNVRAHLPELSEKLGANEIASAAACRISLGFVIRPHHRPAAALAARMNSNMDAIRRIA